MFQKKEEKVIFLDAGKKNIEDNFRPSFKNAHF